MFWLAFIGLTILYTTMAASILWILARYYGKEEWGATFSNYVGNNNTYFFIGVGAIAITFVIACFNFGPAILFPDNLPTPEQRGAFINFMHHLWEGKNAPVATVPTEPLPWARGTWFWWKATFLFFLLTFSYFWFAFWDEATYAVKATWAFIHERREERKKHPQQPAQQATSGQGPTGTVRQRSGLGLELLFEVIAEFLVHFFTRKRAN